MKPVLQPDASQRRAWLVLAAAVAVAGSSAHGQVTTNTLRIECAHGAPVVAATEITAVNFYKSTLATNFGQPYSLAAADFTTNQGLEIVAAGYQANALRLWSQPATGSAWPAQTLATNVRGAHAVAAADINADGNPDIVAAGYLDHSVAWWQNGATGWTRWAISGTCSGAYAVASGRLNTNAWTDVAAAAFNAHEIRWYDNLAGTGQAWRTNLVAAGFRGAAAVACGDLDADGDTDLAGAAFYGDTVQCWLNNNGAGTSWTAVPLATNIDGANAIALADLNGDSRPDVVAAAYAQGRLAWWPNQGAGAFGPTRWIDTALPGAFAVVGADINQDGFMDVAATAYDGNQVAWWENLGGTGTNWLKHVVAADYFGPTALLAMDILGSPFPDLVTASAPLNEVACWSNSATAGLGPLRPVAQPVATNRHARGSQVQCGVSNSPDMTGTTQYVCRGWTGSGSIASGADTLTPLFILTNDSAVTWNWETQFWVAVSAAEHGYVDQPSAWRPAHTQLTVTATPATGYRFFEWQGVPASNQLDNPLHLEITEARDLSARFALRVYTLTATISGSGQVDPLSAQIEHGGTCTLAVVPAPGHCIARVVIDGRYTNAATVQTFANVQADHALHAYFEPQMFSLGVSSERGHPVPPAGYSTQTGGQVVACAVPDAPVVAGSTRYPCTGWRGTGSVPASGATNTTGDAVVMTNDSTITWLWTTQYMLNAASAAPAQGAVTAANGWHAAGDLVTVAAVPAGGYQFYGWDVEEGTLAPDQIYTNPLIVALGQPLQVRAEFKTYRPTVYAIAGNHGSIAPAGATPVNYGADLGLAIAPDPGYRVYDVQVDGVSIGATNALLLTNITSNRTVYAEFAVGTLALDVGSPHGTAVPAAGHHDLVSFTTLDCQMRGTPARAGATQQVLLGWTGSGSVPTNGAGTNTGAFVLGADSAINWLWKTQFWITVTSGPNGSVAFSNAWFDLGAAVTVTAAPAARYMFAGWSGDVPAGQELDNPLALAADQGRAVMARFTNLSFTIAATAYAGGVISPAGAIKVAFSADQAFAVTPDPLYRIHRVEVDGAGIGASNAYVFRAVASDHGISAYFEPNVYTLRVASAYGDPLPPAGGHVLYAGTVTNCLARGSPVAHGAWTQFLCSGWTGSGDVPASGSSTNTGPITITQHSAITWTWRPQYRVDAAPDDPLRGSVARAPSNAWYDAGTTVRVTATAGDIYKFEAWSGGPATMASNNPLALVVTQAWNLVARFSTNYIRLTPVAVGNGTITPSNVVVVTPGGSASFQVRAAVNARIDLIQVGVEEWGLTNLYSMTCTLTNVRQDTVVLAMFTNDYHVLSVASEFDSPEPAVGHHEYFSGTAIACLVSNYAAGTEGIRYACGGWLGSGNVPASGAATSNSFTLTTNSQVAWLWSTQFLLQAQTDGAGTVAPISSGWFPAASNVTLQAVPEPGNLFLYWAGDVPAGSAASNPVALAMTQPRTVTAHFSSTSLSLTVASPFGGPRPPVGTHRYAYGSTVTLDVTNSPFTQGTTRYMGAGWAGSGSVPAAGATTNTGPLRLTNDSTIAWLWQTQYWVGIQTVGIGGVTPASGWYPAGTNLVLVAAPTNRFLGWSGVPATVSNLNPLALAVTQSWSVTAMMVTDAAVRVTVRSDYSATTPPVGDTWLDYGTNQVFNVATPLTWGATQFVCAGWTGGSGSLPATGTNTTAAFTLFEESGLAWNWSTQYLLTATAGSNGAVLTTNGWYRHGQVTALRAVASNGYHFSGWSGDVAPGEMNNPLAVTMNQGRAIRAAFAADNLELIVVSPQAGAVDPAPGLYSVPYGSAWIGMVTNNPVLQDAGAATQSVCAGWTGSGSVPATGSGTNTGLLIIRTNSLLQWQWRTQYRMAAASADAARGLVSQANTSGWYYAGSNATATATPRTGNVFLHWRGVAGTASNSNPLALLMTQSCAVVANFATSRPVLAVSSAYGSTTPAVGIHTNPFGFVFTNLVLASPIGAGAGTQYVCAGWTLIGNAPAAGSNTWFAMTHTNHATLAWLWRTNFELAVATSLYGTVSGASNGWWDYGRSFTLTARPATGQVFAGWSGDVPAAASNDNPLTLVMDRPRALSAGYRIQSLDLVVRSPFGVAHPAPGSNHYDFGAAISCWIEATPLTLGPTQYVLTGWSGTGSVPPTGTVSFLTITSLTANSSLTWTWKTQYQLRANANPGAMGSVAPTNLWLDAGTATQVVARAAEGHLFSHWQGAPPPLMLTNPLPVGMTQSWDLVAWFATNRPVLAIYSAHGMAVPDGTITGDFGRVEMCAITNSTVYDGEDTRHVCRGWTGSGSVPPAGSGLSVFMTITNPSTLTWTWISQYRLEATNGSGGSVSAPSGWHDAGSNVTVRAIPATLHRFDGWIGDLPAPLTNQPEITVAMSQPRYLEARFSTNQARIAATVENPDLGTLTPSGEILAWPGATQEFTLAPNSHCQVAWVVDGLYLGTADTATNYVFSNIMANHTLHAIFQAQTRALSVGTDYSGSESVPPPGLAAYPWNSVVTNRVTNSPAVSGLARYFCYGYTGSGSVPAEDTNTVMSFVLDTDSSITWRWRPEWYLEILSNGFGAVTGVYAGLSAGPVAVGPNWVEQGAVVHLAAVTDTNLFVFQGWTGNTNDTQIPAAAQLAFTSAYPRSLGALFGEILVTNQTPAWWLRHYYPDATNLDEMALADTDSDGQAGWQESVANTDPTDPGSYLCITGIGPSASGGFRINWPNQPDRRYLLGRTINLRAGYTPLASNMTGGAYIELRPELLTNSFYQLQVGR